MLATICAVYHLGCPEQGPQNGCCCYCCKTLKMNELQLIKKTRNIHIHSRCRSTHVGPVWGLSLLTRDITGQNWFWGFMTLIFWLPLVPIWVTGGSTNGTRTKLLPCASKSLTFVGMSELLNKGVKDIKFACSCSELISFTVQIGRLWIWLHNVVMTNSDPRLSQNF